MAINEESGKFWYGVNDKVWGRVENGVGGCCAEVCGVSVGKVSGECGGGEGRCGERCKGCGEM